MQMAPVAGNICTIAAGFVAGVEKAHGTAPRNSGAKNSKHRIFLYTISLAAMEAEIAIQAWAAGGPIGKAGDPMNWSGRVHFKKRSSATLPQFLEKRE